jgi:hypothetical protein
MAINSTWIITPGSKISFKESIDNMNCDDFLDDVKIQFRFLLTDFEYEICFTDEIPSRSGYCLIGFENSVSRLQIFRTWTDGNVWIGDRNSEFSWDIKGWYSARRLLDFKLERPIEYPDFETFPSISQQLENLAETLEPDFQLIQDLIASDTREMWEGEYDRFLENQFKKRFSNMID